MRLSPLIVALAASAACAQQTWTPPPPGMSKLPPREGAKIVARNPDKAKMVDVLPPLVQQPPAPAFKWPDCTKGCVQLP